MGLRRCSLCLRARENVDAMFDGGVWGLVKLPGTAAPDVNTNRAERGRKWPQPSALSHTRILSVGGVSRSIA